MESQPLILSLETSGRLGSVALALGAKLLGERPFSAPMRHSAELFTAVGELLEQSKFSPEQIAQVYVSAGPGSFTGIRLAVSMAKTMALANYTEIVTVCSLDVVARNVLRYDGSPPCRRAGVIVDAKRGQFFAELYDVERDRCKPLGGGRLVRAEDFLAMVEADGVPVHLLGEGLVYYREKFRSPLTTIVPDEYWTGRAAEVHWLGWEKAQRGEFSSPAEAAPIYLRNAIDADSPAKKKPL